MWTVQAEVSPQPRLRRGQGTWWPDPGCGSCVLGLPGLRAGACAVPERLAWVGPALSPHWPLRAREWCHCFTWQGWELRRPGDFSKTEE